MSAIPMARRLIEAYAASEPWKVDHQRAMACRDIEEAMAWGIRLLRGLSDEQATLQARAIAGRSEEIDRQLAEIEDLFRQLVVNLRMTLAGAEHLTQEGFPLDGLDEFRGLAEEAQCQVELWDFERELLPIEEARPRLKPENPRPERYGV